MSEIEITYRASATSPRLIMAVMTANNLTAQRIADLKNMISLVVRQMEQENPE
jgi:hypothetical protein